MKGNWLFAALATLSGILIGLHAPLLLVLSAHLVWIRIFLARNRPLLLLSAVFYGLGFLSGTFQTVAYDTKFHAGSARTPVRFSDYPRIDGNAIKGKAETGKETFMLTYYAGNEAELESLKQILSPERFAWLKGNWKPLSQTATRLHLTTAPIWLISISAGF